MELARPPRPDLSRPIRRLSRASLPSDAHNLSRRALPSDRIGLALFRLCRVLVGSDRAELGPCLSICPIATRALQDAPYFLWKPARPLRGLRLALARARPPPVDSCGRALRDRRGCDHPRR